MFVYVSVQSTQLDSVVNGIRAIFSMGATDADAGGLSILKRNIFSSMTQPLQIIALYRKNVDADLCIVNKESHHLS